MAGKKKQNSISINQYKTKRELNIGTVIFALVFIYLVVAVIAYATDKKISIYEVREGSILRDNSYTGLILREESVVTAENDGYVNYYQSGQSKVKTGMNLCAISPEKLELGDAEQKEGTLSREEQDDVVREAQNFNENFVPQKFTSVYSLKREVEETLQNASDQTRTAQLDAVIAESGQTVKAYPASRDGIMVLTYDGDEGLTRENFSADDFDKSEYTSTNLEDNMQIQKGDPIYKLVTSEEWSVMIPLEDETAKELAETETVKVRLDKSNETTWADFSVLKKEKQYYGCLEFKEAMIRYADKRHLNVELILEDQSGLKIPKSAVVKKPCYAIPQDYLTTGGNSSDQGVMIQDGDSAKFQPVEICYMTEEGIAYINPNELKTGTTLIKPESSETMTVDRMTDLNGVYNINKGYAVFSAVEILCESDEYYIIKEGNAYGLSNYDHIVQNGKDVKEAEVVF